MEKRTYFMFAHKNESGLWCEFPDFDCCATDGENLDDLIKNASDALESIIEAIQDKGGTLPEPSDINILMSKAGACEEPVAFIAPVTAYLPSLPARINITSTEAKIAEITAFAKRVKRTRSELMVDATLSYIRSNA